MKRFVLAMGVLAMAFGISSAARADYAVVKFQERLLPSVDRHRWRSAGWKVCGGSSHHWHHWHYRFHTLGAAERHLHWAVPVSAWLSPLVVTPIYR